MYYLCCLLISTLGTNRSAIDTQEKQEDPKPPVPQSYGLTKRNPNIDPQNFNPNATDIMTKSGAPLTPATLVLLTLASGFAGVKIYRNNKEK